MDLSDAYAIGAYTPDWDSYPPRWAAEASAMRASLGDRAELDLAYGPGARNRYDIFHPEGSPKGLVVFVHGGYWRANDKSSWSQLAAGPLARGWAVAMPSYTLAPEARITTIRQEIAAAVNAAAGRVDGPLVVTGHSAGGHLSARMRCRDGGLDPSVAARLRRVVPISPLSDLRPLMQTDMNADLRLDAAEAEAESPALNTNLHDVETVVWVGADERPALLDQARWLAEAWPRTEHVVVEGKHHFDVIEAMKTADGALTEALVGGL